MTWGGRGVGAGGLCGPDAALVHGFRGGAGGEEGSGEAENPATNTETSRVMSETESYGSDSGTCDRIGVNIQIRVESLKLLLSASVI